MTLQDLLSAIVASAKKNPKILDAKIFVSSDAEGNSYHEIGEVGYADDAKTQFIIYPGDHPNYDFNEECTKLEVQE